MQDAESQRFAFFVFPIQNLVTSQKCCTFAPSNGSKYN